MKISNCELLLLALIGFMRIIYSYFRLYRIKEFIEKLEGKLLNEY